MLTLPLCTVFVSIVHICLCVWNGLDVTIFVRQIKDAVSDAPPDSWTHIAIATTSVSVSADQTKYGRVDIGLR